MEIQRITGGVPSTVFTQTSGTIDNINDDNPTTSCTVNPGTANDPFWELDLGAPKTVYQVVYKNLSQSAGTDTSWYIYYSNNAFNGTSEQGTSFGVDIGPITPTPSSGTQTGTVTARYWGIGRYGDWTPRTLALADLNLFGEATGVVLDLTSKSW